MKFYSAPIFFSLALSACMSTTADQATVADNIVGRQLVTEDGSTIIVNADGTVGGAIGGNPVVGTYVANAKEMCSVYTSPERLVGREFCSTPVFNDDGTMTFTRRDGSSSPIYTIK